MHAFRRKGIAVVMALVVVVLIAGAVSASIPGPNGLISACVDRLGVIRVIDVQAGGRCVLRETPLNWNQSGPAGPAGPAGAAGRPGPAGPTGSPGPAGPSDAFVTTMPEFDPLVDNQPTALATFTLPAGAYVIDAPLRFHSQIIDGGETSVSCDLFANGVQIDNYLLQFRVEEDFQFKVAPLLGSAQFSAPADVVVRCRANYSPGTFSDVGVFEGPIVATRVGSLTFVDSAGPDT